LFAFTKPVLALQPFPLHPAYVISSHWLVSSHRGKQNYGLWTIRNMSAAINIVSQYLILFIFVFYMIIIIFYHLKISDLTIESNKLILLFYKFLLFQKIFNILCMFDIKGFLVTGFFIMKYQSWNNQIIYSQKFYVIRYYHGSKFDHFLFYYFDCRWFCLAKKAAVLFYNSAMIKFFEVFSIRFQFYSTFFWI
jgi:hypothetical protein